MAKAKKEQTGFEAAEQRAREGAESAAQMHAPRREAETEARKERTLDRHGRRANEDGEA